MVKNENTFWSIFWWMGQHLNLSGTEKEIYAIIYGFTQDGNHWFHGKRSYLVSCTNASLSTVTRCLATLIDKGLIEKHTETDEQMQTTVTYRACLDKIPKFLSNYTPCQNESTQCQNDTPQVQNDTGPSVKMTHINNKRYNIKNKINKDTIIDNNKESILPLNHDEDVFSKKPNKVDKKQQCLDMIESQIENETLQEVLKDYFPIWYDAVISDPVKARKINIVNYWKGTVISKLNKGLVEAIDEEPCSVDEQIQAVNNAMRGGSNGPYTVVYRPKTYQQKFSQPKSNNSQQIVKPEKEEYLDIGY